MEVRGPGTVSVYDELDEMLDTYSMVANNLALHLERRGHPARVDPLPLAPQLLRR